jgi:TRAP-type mannitol/chloroaromatic compound transport system permease small subunit
VQASIDLVLYIIFFLPAVLALIYAGWQFARMSIQFREVSIFSPAGVPVFPLKTLIPVTGVMLLLQGLAEITRCILCIRYGYWPQRLHDVEEMETAILHEQEYQRQLREQAQAEGKGA